MIVIADSGGSKTDWRILQRDHAIGQAHGKGFNPYYQPIEDLKQNIEDVLLPQINKPVEKVFFYGAGVSSEKNQSSIKSAFAHYFPGA